jgi:hypothetical protein
MNEITVVSADGGISLAVSQAINLSSESDQQIKTWLISHPQSSRLSLRTVSPDVDRTQDGFQITRVSPGVALAWGSTIVCNSAKGKLEFLTAGKTDPALLGPLGWVSFDSYFSDFQGVVENTFKDYDLTRSHYIFWIQNPTPNLIQLVRDVHSIGCKVSIAYSCTHEALVQALADVPYVVKNYVTDKTALELANFAYTLFKSINEDFQMTTAQFEQLASLFTGLPVRTAVTSISAACLTLSSHSAMQSGNRAYSFTFADGWGHILSVFKQFCPKISILKPLSAASPVSNYEDEIVAEFTAAVRYSFFAKDQSGALLYGLPGTGKTVAVAEVARRSGHPAYILSSSDFASTLVGQAEEKMQAIQDQLAASQAPCLVLVDEADTVFPGNQSNIVPDASVNRVRGQIQAAMTDPKLQHVFWVFATNEPTSLPMAILSRLKYKYHFPGCPIRDASALLKQKIAASFALYETEDRAKANDLLTEQLSSKGTEFLARMNNVLAEQTHIPYRLLDAMAQGVCCKIHSHIMGEKLSEDWFRETLNRYSTGS